jgi:predicted permease
MEELRFTFRRIRRRPFHAASIALTLGLGIGAAIAVFGAVDAILLRPLPFSDADRLVRVTQRVPVEGFPELNFSDVGFRRLQQGNRTLAGAAAYNTRAANLVRADGTERLTVARVSANLVPVLRIRTAIGRFFTTDEDVPGGTRLLVLTDHFWRSAFNADTGIVGRVLDLEGVPYTVIGVLDARTVFPSRDVSAWEPLQLGATSVTPFQLNYSVVARLREGASLEQARRDLLAPIRDVGREYPGPHPGSALDPAGYAANVRPLAAALVGDVRPVVALLLTGVIALLLLTCANVANLQLAAVISRAEELSVRVALGATNVRLIRGQVVEGVILSAAGACVGFGVALMGARLVASILPPSVAFNAAGLGYRAILITVIIVLMVGATVGALPVLVLTRRAPAAALREHAFGSAGAARVRKLLASAQIALAVVLLHGSGLLLGSAARVAAVDLGFQPEGTISLRINIPDPTLRDRNVREGLLRRIVSSAAALPGVAAVGLTNTLPLTPGARDLAMAVEGRPFKADGTDPIADFRIVSEGYFAALGIPVTRGRIYTDDEATDRLTPLVINETLARRLFPDGEDPIGQRLRFGPVAPWMPIVGVVADAKNRSLTEPPMPELYTPALGSWSMLALRSGISVVLRARGDAMSLSMPMRRIIRDIAPDVAVERVVPVGTVVKEANVRMTTTTRLISWYAAAALLIAVAGTYAVLSYLIAQRRSELALRMALGAPTRAIVTLVARESAVLVGAGAVAGLAGAVASSRLLAGLLYGIGTLDAGVLAVVVFVAATAGTLAAIAPVRRALRADPSEVLRSGS